MARICFHERHIGRQSPYADRTIGCFSFNKVTVTLTDKDSNTVATGIQELKTTQSKQGVYDLMGRRVAQPVKGLYIVNGKKFMVK